MPKEELPGEKENEPYNEEDLSREAEAYKLERTTKGLSQSYEFEDDGFYTSFLNNFRSHLPGGYKRGIPKFAELEKDINDAIERLGFDADEIARWGKQEPSSDEEKKIRLDTQKALYIEMRKLGYPHYPDLSA